MPPIIDIARPLVTGILLAFSLGTADAQSTELRFGSRVPPEVESIYEDGLEWLADRQGADGKWPSSHSGSGVDGICVMSFLASGEDPNFGRFAPNIRRGIRAIITAQDAETGYMPNSMYHHGFAMLALAEAYGAVDESLLWTGEEQGAKRRTIAEALDLAIRCASTSNEANKQGGWRYNPDQTDADTSVTGAVLMGLLASRNAGMEVPQATVDKALQYFRTNTSKSGSVAYSGGAAMGQSMNRSAIATLVYAVSRDKGEWHFDATLDHLTSRLEHQERGSYEEYFRYYMAQSLFQGDYESWQKWNAATIRQLEASQTGDGSFKGDAYATGMSLLAIALNYRFLPIYER